MKEVMRQIQKTILFFVLSAAILIKPARAQEIKIGEQLPDVTVKNVFNYTSDKIRFNDLKGKLIILDFWDPTCGGCIEAFPKMDSLQKQFGNKIQIILVNRQSEDSTKKFFAKHSRIKLPSVPLVTADTILQKFFHHFGEPYNVWIDAKGSVLFTTHGYNTTDANITKYLQGDHIDLPKYIIKPIGIETFFDKKLVGYYSYIAHWSPDFRLVISPDDQEINCYAYTLQDLYQTAYNGPVKYAYERFTRPGRVILHVADPSKFIFPKDANDLWRANNLYNYQLLIPKDKINQKYQIMQEDLKRYFGLKASIEMRMIRSLVLIRSGKGIKLSTADRPTKDNFFTHDIKEADGDSIRFFYNKPYKDFSERLTGIVEYGLKRPFTDETGLKGMVNIEMKSKTLDNLNILDVNRELNRYGLKIVEKYVKLEVLVISDNAQIRY